MRGLKARAALSAAGIWFAVLCSGCAWWDRAPGSQAIAFASTNVASDAAAPRIDEVLPAPASAPIGPASLARELWRCLDGAVLQISYPGGRDVALVTLNGASPILMRREHDADLTAYRAESLVLHRSGARVAIGSEETTIIVQSGDTLGRIALRVYGDLTRAMEIARVNNIKNPDLIFPGQTLYLPRAERRCRRTQEQAAAYWVEASASERPNTSDLNRRQFTPPNYRQPDHRRVRASVTDPPLR